MTVKKNYGNMAGTDAEKARRCAIAGFFRCLASLAELSMKLASQQAVFIAAFGRCGVPNGTESNGLKPARRKMQQ